MEKDPLKRVQTAVQFLRLEKKLAEAFPGQDYQVTAVVAWSHAESIAVYLDADNGQRGPFLTETFTIPVVQAQVLSLKRLLALIEARFAGALGRMKAICLREEVPLVQ